MAEQRGEDYERTCHRRSREGDSQNDEGTAGAKGTKSNARERSEGGLKDQ